MDPAALAREAAQRLELRTPAIGMNPAPDRDQLVNLRTWLWVTRRSWTPQQATASVPGVSATVVARPARVVCRGPGTPYDPARPAREPGCGYMYRRSSAGAPEGRLLVTATITWNVSWSATGVTGGGSLPAASRSTQVPVRVAEIQALN